MSALWSEFYPQNPFSGYVPEGEPDAQGWGSDSAAFTYVAERCTPRTVIEVGSWKGASILHMAALWPEAQFLAIDTWLGSLEAWQPDGTEENQQMFYSLKRRFGYPQLYYTFAGNIVRAGLTERVTPLPMPSSVAAQLLRLRGITADVVYIDGSHEYRDVKNDLMDYWPLVRPGGFLIGDDLGWDGVRKAATTFFRYFDAVVAGKYIVRRIPDNVRPFNEEQEASLRALRELTDESQALGLYDLLPETKE